MVLLPTHVIPEDKAPREGGFQGQPMSPSNELTLNPANGFCLRKVIYVKLGKIGFSFEASVIKSIMLTKRVGCICLNRVSWRLLRFLGRRRNLSAFPF